MRIKLTFLFTLTVNTYRVLWRDQDGGSQCGEMVGLGRKGWRDAGLQNPILDPLRGTLQFVHDGYILKSLHSCLPECIVGVYSVIF